jgi:glycosyltransferase involved in cell wall biosynthesis
MPRTVAVIWQRFGPYHLARLRGADSALRSMNWQVLGIEIAGKDEYDWDIVHADAIRRCTLFPDETYAAVASNRVHSEIDRVLDAVSPDAVCVNGWAVPEAVSALRWCVTTKTPSIVMAETFEPSGNPIKQAVKRWRVRHCHAAIVGGRAQAGYLRSLGLAPERIELGYDVVDNAHFSSVRPSRPDWVRCLRAKRYFLANTRFLARKAIDQLLRAFAWYVDNSEQCQQDAWQLVIAGSGERESTWKALAVALGIDARVHWPGFVQYDDLPALYQAAGAFVHPARREAWGLVVNEAAAAALPLIVGHRVGAACELVRDGENGFLVDPDDVEGFGSHLSRVASVADEERARMGRLSQALVSEFGPERFGQALRRCLRLLSDDHEIEPCAFSTSSAG